MNNELSVFFILGITVMGSGAAFITTNRGLAISFFSMGAAFLIIGVVQQKRLK